jgi:hypothetical protein
LNRVISFTPFFPHTQQCHGFLSPFPSLKFTSSLGLWWWQNGQLWAWLPLAVGFPGPKTELTSATRSWLTI